MIHSAPGPPTPPPRPRPSVAEVISSGAGAVSAHQRDRAAQQTHQRMHVQQPGHTQAHGALPAQTGDQREQEGDEPGAALGQQFQVRRQPDAAEEQQQQGGLDAGLHRDRHAAPGG
ncbi:hypothetical protein G6F21_014147 [Rhizopus arrhizus]|nr:hypothetical protein G6F21_014147 [Rhizopus arrhizus]